MRRLILWVVMIGFLSGCTVYLPPSHRPKKVKKIKLPKVVVIGAPRFVVMTDSNVAVMVGVDADIYRVNGYYYHYHDRIWYDARHYEGPWVAIASKDLPPGLRGKAFKKLKKAKSKHKKHRKKHKG